MLMRAHVIKGDAACGHADERTSLWMIVRCNGPATISTVTA
jgi:hypothetical protein